MTSSKDLRGLSYCKGKGKIPLLPHLPTCLGLAGTSGGGAGPIPIFSVLRRLLLRTGRERETALLFLQRASPSFSSLQGGKASLTARVAQRSAASFTSRPRARGGKEEKKRVFCGKRRRARPSAVCWRDLVLQHVLARKKAGAGPVLLYSLQPLPRKRGKKEKGGPPASLPVAYCAAGQRGKKKKDAGPQTCVLQSSKEGGRGAFATTCKPDLKGRNQSPSLIGKRRGKKKEKKDPDLSF